MKIALTGATGFVGRHIAESCCNDDLLILGRRSDTNHKGIFIETDFSEEQLSAKMLSGVDVLVHCAAMAGVNEKDEQQLKQLNTVNVDVTIALARAAMSAGVKRFIFISSVKVLGESSDLVKPLTNSGVYKPEDAYGKSKADAELKLIEISKEGKMEIVVIRPPLIYGEGVGGNFALMVKLVHKRLPIPFGCATNNRRSLVSVYNLVNMIRHCMTHPGAIEQPLLVSDDSDTSTRDIFLLIAKVLQKKCVLIPVPLSLFKLLGKLFGLSDMVNKLFGTLQLDITKTKEQIGWTPPYTMEHSLEMMFNKKRPKY